MLTSTWPYEHRVAMVLVINVVQIHVLASPFVSGHWNPEAISTHQPCSCSRLSVKSIRAWMEVPALGKAAWQKALNGVTTGSAALVIPVCTWLPVDLKRRVGYLNDE